METTQGMPTGLKRFLRPKFVIPAVILAIALAAFVLYWFEPQALFIDKRVDERAPGVQDAMKKEESMAKDDAMAEDKMMTLAGDFRGLNHSTKGKASLTKQEDGSYVLRLEEFETENGPDLKVYLSAAPADADPSTFDDDFVDLGDLKGNIGNQNYTVPAGMDVAKYRSAVIWCKRFNVGFGVAPLSG